MKKEKGITLVALMITIVVLIILAVVSITSISEGDIINGAQTAANAYSNASAKHQYYMDEGSDLLNGYLKNMPSYDE